jgi:IclR family transcriptional regulator, acetate operon repressor
METEDRTAGIQVIARAASIMRLLSEHPPGLSLSAIATEIGLARSTVQRIVQALQAEGMVELAGPQGGFQLGPTLAQLVYRQQADIVTVARPLLETLCGEIEETVALCGLAGAQVTTLDRCVAERTLRVVFPLGTIPHPAHRLAPGLAILSALPEARVTHLLAASVPPGDLAATQAEIARLRTTGRAMDTADFNPELSGFAVPLRSGFGVHAIAAIVPAARASGQADRIHGAILACRDAIEDKLGAPAAAGVSGRR